MTYKSMLQASHFSHPELQTLTKGLNAVFRKNGAGRTPVTVLNRESVFANRTFESEIVTCRFADGQKRKLFCKYGPSLRRGHPKGRQGVAYEAAVYQHLQRFLVSTPILYGVHTDRARGQVWLILQYLNQAQPLNLVSGLTDTMCRAAQELGQFHAAQATSLPPELRRILYRYDARYYRRWLRYPSAQAVGLRRRYPWLSQVCRRFEEWINCLTPPTTIIHGDLVSDHLLVRGKKIFTIDWNRAAFAVGEIDLANLTWGWGTAIREECVRTYQQTRWPQGVPLDFRSRLDAAELYLRFRWLREEEDPKDPDRFPLGFEKLGALARRLSIV